MRKLSLSVLIAVFLIMALVFLSTGVSFSQEENTTDCNFPTPLEQSLCCIGEGLGFCSSEVYAFCLSFCPDPIPTHFIDAQNCVRECTEDFGFCLSDVPGHCGL